MCSPLASSYSSCSSFINLEITWFDGCLKISARKMSAYPLNQYDLMVHEPMKVHREEAVFPSIYPCHEFMRVVGILQDFQTMVTNAGLEHFVEGEPIQYVKLTMAFVQDFWFTWSTSNPMVHYKIYNIPVDLPFADFCAAIRVP